jgi:hypothetical protein
MLLGAVGLLVAPHAFAATITWDGGGSTNNWSEAANWTGDTLPGSTGSILFNGTSTKSVTVDRNIRVQSLTITSAYSGTLTQSGRILIGTGGYIQGGGTFLGSSVPIVIQSGLTLSGGTLQSTSGILSISGSLLRTGGTFSANGGTVSLAGYAPATVTNAQAFSNLNVESALETGLAAYWKLDEPSIPTYRCTGVSAGCPSVNSQYRTAVDSSGNGWDVSAPNIGWIAATNWPAHTDDAAPTSFANPGGMHFVRTRSWLYNANGPVIGTNGTYAFWMKDSDITTQQVVMTLGSQLFFVQNGQWVVQGGACDMYNNRSSASFLSDGGWHHIAIVKNAADNTCTTYVDGAAARTVFSTGAVLLGNGIMIGNLSGFDAIGMTSGSLDDVRVYSRALSAAEVARLAAGTYTGIGGGSTVALASNLRTNGLLKIINGTLAPSSYALTGSGITLSDATLNLSAATADINGALQILGTSTLTAPASLTVSGNFSKDSTATFAANNGTVTLDGSNQTILGSTAFANLTKVPAGLDTLSIGAGTTQTINGTLTLKGVSMCTPFSLRSTVTGSPWTITATSASLQYLNVQDSIATAALGTTGIDNGNNTKWTITMLGCHPNGESIGTSATQSGGGGGGGGGSHRPANAASSAGSPAAGVSHSSSSRHALPTGLQMMRDRLAARIDARVKQDPSLAPFLQRLLERLDERLAKRGGM